MPKLYAYVCRHCGAEWDLRREMHDRNRAAHCASCGVWSGRRVLTAPNLRGETVART